MGRVFVLVKAINFHGLEVVVSDHPQFLIREELLFLPNFPQFLQDLLVEAVDSVLVLLVDVGQLVE